MHGIKRVKNLKEKILFEHKHHEFVFKWLEMNSFFTIIIFKVYLQSRGHAREFLM